MAYFAIMLFARGIGLYEGMVLYNITLVIGMLLFGVKILCTEHTVFEYLWMGALFAISLLVYYNTGEKGLLVYFTMMLGVKGVSVLKASYLGLVVWGVSFSALFIGTLFGLIDDICFIHEKHFIGYIICHTMGYPHSNVLHISYMVLVFFIIYSFHVNNKLNYIKLITILMLGNIFVFAYSLSFTGLIATTVLLMSCMYFRFRKHISYIEKVLIEMIFPLCLAFSIILPVIVEGDNYDLLSKFTNTRSVLSRYFLTEQPLTLFGSRLVVPNYRYTMDCSYVYALVQLGIIPFILICVLFCALIHYCLQKNKRKELALIIGFIVAGSSEPFMFNLAYKNLIFIFLGKYLFELSSGISPHLCELMNYKVQLIKIELPESSRIISITLNKIILYMKTLINKVNQKSGVFLFAFVAAFIFMILACRVILPETTEVYVSEEMNANSTSEVYLTKAEVDNIRKQGNIVKDYEDENSVMYLYSGEIAKIEYYRNIIGRASVLSASLVVILAIMYLLFGDKRVMIRKRDD